MGKTITLTRDELVWQTRRNTWTEEDYKRLLEWLKGFADREDQSDSFVRNHAAEYYVLSQYTWDQVVNYIKNGIDEEEPRIYYSYSDGSGYTESIEQVMIDYIREDNYDADVCDEEYADDYNENFSYDED